MNDTNSLIGLITALLFMLSICLSAGFFIYKSDKQKHETLRLLIDKATTLEELKVIQEKMK